VSCDEPLQRVGTQEPAARVWEDRGVLTCGPLGKPCPKNRGDIVTQRSAAHLSPLARAPHVRADTEVHVASSQGADFSVTQPRFGRHEQHGTVSPADPCGGVGRSDERRGLFLGEKLHRPALVTFGRDRQDALALQRARRLDVRDKAEERPQSSKAGVAGFRAIGAPVLQVVEEGAEQRRVEILHAEPGRRPFQAL
jgi:hypothetical protein